MTDRTRFLAGYPFGLDRFQITALDALDAGEHVVVAAPTGSGKTVVAEFGIATALDRGERAFYTAPIKALSNQKYRDLVERHGREQVGLLTGDNSVNPDAPVVVMTTEVLRNMIYGRSRALDRLGLVVLDEVHYLQDAYRGPVWEEVIIHLPRQVRLVCLSATVSNVDELAEWIATVRGPTRAVVERRRPVELVNQYLVADRTSDRLRMLPVLVGGHPNRDALKLDEAATGRTGTGRTDGQGRTGATRGAARRALATPGRVETVELLAERGLLPTIYFIFSRNACDDAARSCHDAGLVLTTGDERDRIREIVDERLGALDAEDLDVLGLTRFQVQLEAGIAAHHAGMVPPMKETVEACFVAGLVKVVFATETLALGINMPARTVVIEKLTKFTGEHHEQLTPGEYTQLTGRAGRRGIDERGDAVVLWSPWVRFGEVAQLAASSSYHLRSAFRTTYNMAANLVRTYDRDEAHHLLNLSYAQFQADRDIVRMEARLERKRGRLNELRTAAASPFGDIDEYRRTRDAERRARDERRRAARGETVRALAGLTPGTVIADQVRSRKGPFVVVSVANRSAGLKLTLIDRSGKPHQVTDDDFDAAPQVVGRITMPPGFAPQRRDYREEVAYRLRRAKLRGGTGAGGAAGDGRQRDAPPGAPNADPLERDPDLTQRLRAAGQADRVGREIEDLERRVAAKDQSLSVDFDRVLGVLTRYGYVDLERWQLLPDGLVLARVFHECDLLVSEVLRHGLLDGLGAPDVAALVSTFVYEHRSPEPPVAPWFSSHDVRRRWRSIAATSEDLQAVERAVGLTPHRPPDPTFAAVAHAWVSGESFADVVTEEDVTGGDFVRTIRQLTDLLRQLALVAPHAGTRDSARTAAEAAYRGVVSDSAVVVVPPNGDDDPGPRR